jgi:hypothetical protein
VVGVVAVVEPEVEDQLVRGVHLRS